MDSYSEIFLLLDNLLKLPDKEFIEYEKKNVSLFTDKFTQKIYKQKILNLGISVLTYNKLETLNYNNRILYNLILCFIRFDNNPNLLIRSLLHQNEAFIFTVADIINFDIYKYITEEEIIVLFQNNKENIIDHLHASGRLKYKPNYIFHSVSLDSVNFFKKTLSRITDAFDTKELYFECERQNSWRIRNYLLNELHILNI